MQYQTNVHTLGGLIIMTALKNLKKALESACFNPNVTLFISVHRADLQVNYFLNGGDLDDYTVDSRQIILHNKDNYVKICLKNMEVEYEKGEYILTDDGDRTIITISFL